MKALRDMINDAEISRKFWEDAANDPEALRALDKSRDRALMLENYFEGKYDGLCDALRLTR